MVNKILNVRVFDENGTMWKKGVKDSGLELLCGKERGREKERKMVLFIDFILL
jgi:predicted RNA-binding protein with PUA domain